MKGIASLKNISKGKLLLLIAAAVGSIAVIFLSIFLPIYLTRDKGNEGERDVHQDDTVDDYTFYINKTIWLIRYDRGIKCWLLFIGNEQVINKYDEISEFYIDGEGSVREWRSYPAMDEEFIKILYEEHKHLKNKLMTVQFEQESGTRKIEYPKEKRCGRISRRDFYNGMDDEQRQKYWAFKFSEENIKYIDKTPVIAPLTLREYFRLCRLYYLANQGDYIRDVPDDPKEAYMRFADGRTERMETVDLDDPQDFYDWVKKEGKWKGRSSIGHPHEITGKTYLYPHYTDGVNGYYLWSGFIWNYDKVVTFCHEPNLMLNDYKYLVDIIKGNGVLEVSPSFNRYGYPNEEFQEHVNYGDLTRKQKNKIVWDELLEAQIKQ
jgi:hypothetical protein